MHFLGCHVSGGLTLNFAVCAVGPAGTASHDGVMAAGSAGDRVVRALLAAAQRGDVATLEALAAAHGADAVLGAVDAAGSSGLHRAAMGGAVASVEWLARQGTWRSRPLHARVTTFDLICLASASSLSCTQSRPHAERPLSPLSHLVVA